MQVQRCGYFVPTNQIKTNGEKLNQNDMFNIGYMAGRFGINLDGNARQNYAPKIQKDGITVNINSCTAALFEDNLKKSGIKFDSVA